jgi:hypothetical protein
VKRKAFLVFEERESQGYILELVSQISSLIDVVIPVKVSANMLARKCKL